MSPFLTSQIIAGKVAYKAVVDLYPKLKPEIDALLISRGHSYLIED